MPKPKRSHIGFRLDRIEPSHDPDWSKIGPRGERSYWNEAARVGMKVKQASILKGLGRDGGPLRDITTYTRQHRKSAMTASKRGDPAAPPLVPGRELSRTYQYLRYEVEADGVWFFWRYDRHTGMSWGIILTYQQRQGRDTIGLSADDWDAIVEEMDRWWARHKGYLVRLEQGRQERAAKLRTPKPATMPRPVITPGPIVKPTPPRPVPTFTLPIAAPIAVAAQPKLKPLEGIVTSAAEAKLVRDSNRSGIFSGWRRTKAAVFGSLFHRPEPKRKAR